MGRPRDPDYWKKYRRNHPEYRMRDRLRNRLRKKRMTAEQRRRDRGRKKPKKQLPEIPSLHQGHEILEQAKQIARITSGFKYLTHPYYDDLIGAIALALCEGTSGELARTEFLNKEMEWQRRVVQLFNHL